MFETGLVRRIEKTPNMAVHIPFYTRVFQMGVFQLFPTKPLYVFLLSPVRSKFPHAPTHFIPGFDRIDSIG